jgi:hypothetical protein
MHVSILLVDFRASFAEPGIDRVRIKTLADQAADDARDGIPIQPPWIGALQPPVERRLQQRRFVEVAEDLVDRGSRGFGTDAQLLNLLQDAPAAPPFDVRTRTGRGERHAAIVQRPIGRQALDDAIDLVVREVPPTQAVAQLPARQLASTKQRERGGVDIQAGSNSR